MKFRTMLEHRVCRLMFVRFLHQSYRMPVQTAYAKLREHRVKKWECEGINACIREYAPSYRGKRKEFYENLFKKKLDFLNFMYTKEMCWRTAAKRFRAFDFTELELQGIDTAFEKFLTVHPEVRRLVESGSEASLEEWKTIHNEERKKVRSKSRSKSAAKPLN